MDKEAFDDFLKRRYYSALIQYKNRAFSNQQMYKRLQWFTIVLSVITAILVGSEQFFNWTPIKLLALATSVIVSGLATALKTFSYQEKWALYNKISTDLENEFDSYKSSSGSYADESDKESLFVSKIIAILNERAASMLYATIPPPTRTPQELPAK